MSRRPVTRRGLLGYGGMAIASGLAGCLGDDDGNELGRPEAHVEVRMEEEGDGGRFEPPIVHLVRGGTIEWIVDRGIHDVTAYHPRTNGNQRRIPPDAEPWESDRLNVEGETFDRVLDVEGVYDYACTAHEEGGMVGTVVVGWPHPDEEPALEAPSASYPPAAADALEEGNERVRSMLEDEHG